MYFSVGRNFGMRALIEAIPVSPGSSRKVRSRHTCVFPTAVFLTRGGNLLALVGPALARKTSVAKNIVYSLERAPKDRIDKRRLGHLRGSSGHLRGSLLLRTRRHLHSVRVCVLIFYVLFREPQLLDASSDRGDSGGAGKLSKS